MLLRLRVFVLCPKSKEEIKISKCAVCPKLEFTSINGPRNTLRFSLTCHDARQKLSFKVDCPMLKEEIDAKCCEVCSSFNGVNLRWQLGLNLVCKYNAEGGI
jgi:hypothetical protein